MNWWPWIGIGGLLLFWNKLQASGGMTNIINITNDLPKGSKPYGKRALSQIQMFVIHHSATNSGDPWAYARYHVETRGWPGIGYHFVVQKDGTIYQTNELTTLSYHTDGQNTKAVGICLTGSYDTSEPPPAQYNALILLLRHLGTLLGQKPIYGHNQFSSKSCPGNAIEVGFIEAEAWGKNAV